MESLSQAQIKTLANAGFTFAVRYIPCALPPPAPAVPLGKDELGWLIDAGLGVMLVQFWRDRDWSMQSGLADGAAAAKAVQALGLPTSTCVWFDYDLIKLSAAAGIEYANACFEGAVGGGLPGSALGGYFEPGVPLTAQQLFADLHITRYWRTASQTPDVETRGYQFVQVWPGNIKMANGITIDIDFTQEDYLGSAPVWAAAGP
jgi:hypothetical protein